MGFGLFTAANDHIGAYGQSGLTTAIDALGQRDLPYAGIGRNRAADRARTYVETPAGRVALIAATTTFVPGNEAAPHRRDVRGRPGIAPLRLRPRYSATDEHLEALRELHEALGRVETRPTLFRFP